MVTTIRTELGWTIQRTQTGNGCTYEYKRQFTLSGAAENLDLTIPFPIQLNLIQWFSNDATAKSFTGRIFAGAGDTYLQIANLAADTNISNSYAGDLSDNYTQAPIRIRTAVSASTAGKLLTITINVKRLS